jgi:hypothetical protein
VFAVGVTEAIVAPLAGDRGAALRTLEALAPARWR